MELVSSTPREGAERGLSNSKVARKFMSYNYLTLTQPSPKWGLKMKPEGLWGGEGVYSTWR